MIKINHKRKKNHYRFCHLK